MTAPPDDFRRMTDEEAQVAVTHLRARELGATVAGNTEGADLLRWTSREFEAARSGEAEQRRRAEALEARLKEIAADALEFDRTCPTDDGGRFARLAKMASGEPVDGR